MFEIEELKLKQELKRIEALPAPDLVRVSQINIRLDDIRELRYSSKKELEIIL